MPGNRQIWHLITLAVNPWRVGAMGGYFGLDLGLLREMAADLHIARTSEFYGKLKAFEVEALKYLNQDKDGERCDEKQKEKCKIEFPDFLDWACKQCGKKATV